MRRSRSPPPRYREDRRGYEDERRGYEDSRRYDDRRGYGRRDGPSRGGGRSRGNSLLVRNLALDVRPDEIRELFERYGPVRDVYLPKDYYTKEPRGFGFVEFKYPEDAGDAKHALDRMMFAGKELAVLFAQQGRKDPSEMTRRTERRSRSPPRGRRSRSPRGRSRSPRRRSPSPRRERSRSRSPRDSPRRASPTGWGDDSPRANKSPVERMPAESPRNEA